MNEKFEDTDKYPYMIRVDREINERYLKKLQQEISSPFYKVDLTDIYFMAGVIGYLNNMHEETKESSDLRLYSQLSDGHKIIIRSIATKLNSNDLKIILEGKEICKIFEEYANSGSKLLHDMVFDRNFDKFSDYVWNEVKAAVEEKNQVI